MDGMLSQEEINRLLNSIDTSEAKEDPERMPFSLRNSIKGQRDDTQDLLLLSELRRVYDRLREVELQLTDAEKREKHQVFVKHGKELAGLSKIAREQGLLALEEEASGMREDKEKEFEREALFLIVDGTDPKFVKRSMMMQYISTQMDPYRALQTLMSIYALLGIQAGEHPVIIMEMLRDMMPEDIRPTLETFEEWYCPEQERKTMDIEWVCGGDFRIAKDHLGYLETYLCEKSLLSMDRDSVQKVLREANIYAVRDVMKGFSGEGRKYVFENVSERVAQDIACDLKEPASDPRCKDDVIYVEYYLKPVRKAAIYMLKLIRSLDGQRQITYNLSMDARLLSRIITGLEDSERSGIDKLLQGDTLSNLLKNYAKDRG